MKIWIWYKHTSTIGYSAKRDGTKGYVVSGHLCHYNLPTPIGWYMYQPTLDWPPNPNYKAGYVLDVSGAYEAYSDSAFVEFNNVTGCIYVYSSISRDLVWGYNDPGIGDTVYMSGITSGLVSGKVAQTGKDIPDPTHGVLYDQVYATYHRASGDSGAPVFKLVKLIPGWVSFVWINGIHVGYYQGYAFFSPQSGVEADIGAIPLRFFGG